MLLLAASLLFTDPLPLDMPRAEGYLVRERGVCRLEDRFNKLDLWVSQSVDGRWMDVDGRVFMLSHLDVLPPEGDAARSVATRKAYIAGRVRIDPRDKQAVRTAVAALSPVEVPEKEARPHQMPRGCKDLDYWQGTNRTAIVCAYLPERERVWRLAVWQLAEGDDYDECLKLFEEEFFKDGVRAAGGDLPPPVAKPSERELLRADAHHAVAAYPNWHVTDAESFAVLDALPDARNFVVTLTNDLAVLRRKCAEVLPPQVDGSNALCVARIYANRGDYLDALAASGLTNMAWSAAYWSPARRELVAHLPADGSRTTLRATIRHEAFHQYLSYATAMIPAAPWLNEGYAQYFENEEWQEGGSDWRTALDARPSAEELEQYAAMLPALLLMDYEEFYSGTDAQRRLKYALARSVATFLERGAPLVRFKPFARLKQDYVEALLETQDMRVSTLAAFKDKDLLEKFVAEWLKYWKER